MSDPTVLVAIQAELREAREELNALEANADAAARAKTSFEKQRADLAALKPLAEPEVARLDALLAGLRDTELRKLTLRTRIAALKAEEASILAGQRRKNLVEQLATTRAELRVRRAEFAALERTIKSAQAEVELHQRQFAAVVQVIAASEQQRPRAAQFLPAGADPDVDAWRRRHAALEEERERLIAKRATLPNLHLLRLEAVRLNDRITAVTSTQEDIERALSGVAGLPLPSERGGVFAA
jgi:chromosome segregation ATPase